MSLVRENETPAPCVVCGKRERVPVTTRVAGTVDGERGVVCLPCIRALRAWLKLNNRAIERAYFRPVWLWEPTPLAELHGLDTARPEPPGDPA